MIRREDCSVGDSPGDLPASGRRRLKEHVPRVVVGRV